MTNQQLVELARRIFQQTSISTSTYSLFPPRFRDEPILEALTNVSWSYKHSVDLSGEEIFEKARKLSTDPLILFGIAKETSENTHKLSTEMRPMPPPSFSKDPLFEKFSIHYRRTLVFRILISIRQQDGAELARCLAELESCPSKNGVAALVSLMHFLSGAAEKSGVAVAWPTAEQLQFYAEHAGLDENDKTSILAFASNSLDRQTDYEVTQHEILSIDGNVVRKLGGRGLQAKGARTREVPVQLWLSESLTLEEQADLLSALQDFLIEEDLTLSSYEEPVKGSFRWFLKFFGTIRPYSNRLAANLMSALQSTSDHSQIDAVIKLSKALSKHREIILIVDQYVAIRTQLGRETKQVVVRLTPALRAKLDADPSLISRPLELLKYVTAETVTPFLGRGKLAATLGEVTVTSRASIAPPLSSNAKRTDGEGPVEDDTLPPPPRTNSLK